jgi:hypothetical protein
LCRPWRTAWVARAGPVRVEFEKEGRADGKALYFKLRSRRLRGSSARHFV